MNELFDKTDLEENFVEYFIYFKNLTENVKIPNKDNLEASLIELSIQIFSFINKYTKNYVWQKEQFQLKICYSTGKFNLIKKLINLLIQLEIFINIFFN